MCWRLLSSSCCCCRSRASSSSARVEAAIGENGKLLKKRKRKRRRRREDHKEEPPKFGELNRYVWLSYYIPPQDTPDIMTRCTFWLCPPFSHVDLVFPVKNEEGIRLAISITRSTKSVLAGYKVYKTGGYYWQRVRISSEGLRRALEVSEAMDGKGYMSTCSMIRTGLGVPGRSLDPDGSWFCSELIVHILKAGGLLQDVVPGSVLPTQLYWLLRREHRAKGVRPPEGITELHGNADDIIKRLGIADRSSRDSGG